ncbi:MAG TPA: DUF1080 domain-containing protein [Bacteroidales bacterium]|nr:DUF1080 domain-containing protein [Bacteroidales bacterium]
MKRLVISLFLITLFVAGSQVFYSCKPGGKGADSTSMVVVDSNNMLTAQEQAEGWILMFDGKTFTGWRGYSLPAFPDSGWAVDSGAIRCIGSGMGEAGGKGGDIIYDRKFKDFRLKLEWKISSGGNSGIFYLGQEIPEEPVWKSAPEMQVLDNVNHPDALLGKDGNRMAGSLYDLIPAGPQNAKPVGEWNQVEILIYQGTVVHFQNGEKVLEYHIGTPDWDKMIKESKFKDFPEFGKYLEGYIALQDHGNDVWYRNIKIKGM